MAFCRGRIVKLLSDGPHSLHLSYSVVFRENRLKSKQTGVTVLQ